MIIVLSLHCSLFAMNTNCNENLTEKKGLIKVMVEDADIQKLVGFTLIENLRKEAVRSNMSFNDLLSYNAKFKRLRHSSILTNQTEAAMMAGFNSYDQLIEYSDLFNNLKRKIANSFPDLSRLSIEEREEIWNSVGLQIVQQQKLPKCAENALIALASCVGITTVAIGSFKLCMEVALVGDLFANAIEPTTILADEAAVSAETTTCSWLATGKKAVSLFSCVSSFVTSIATCAN